MVPRIAPLRNYNKNNNTRCCKKCTNWKDLSEFSSRKRMPSPSTKDLSKIVPTLYYREVCKECSISSVNKEEYCGNKARKEQHRKDPRKVMYLNTKYRAAKLNLPFNLEKSDIVIPEFCPLLGIPLQVGNKASKPNSPSIDRLIPSKGYVKGNILVISHRANAAKNNLSVEELELLITNLKRVLNKEEELLES